MFLKNVSFFTSHKKNSETVRLWDFSFHLCSTFIYEPILIKMYDNIIKTQIFHPILAFTQPLPIGWSDDASPSNLCASLSLSLYFSLSLSISFSLYLSFSYSLLFYSLQTLIYTQLTEKCFFIFIRHNFFIK